ncbi:hypothetical protein [Steroidobacter cummioxidans]|uniref:hypothetical protein n=1 Tax=Steroidobacter cummioxidans TaxID=1803913 RepID=UPI000E31EED7|nr:hypothetical protein [Steroidobacter cummioxidans]
MNTPLNPNEQHEQLERFIDQALRDQPVRRAPVDLESKVMAEIARRAAAPWWQGSFSGWPVAARLLFIIGSAGFITLVLKASAMIIDPINPGARSAALFADVAWIPSLFMTIGTVFRDLPSLWVYGGATILGALYLTLFGVSAAAYRTLYAPR